MRICNAPKRNDRGVSNSEICSQHYETRNCVDAANLHTRNRDSIEARVSPLPMERRCTVDAVSELQFANAQGRTGEVKVQRALRASDSPVSRRTGERRTFWPCPKYCDWLTRTLVYLADHGGGVCSFSSIHNGVILACIGEPLALCLGPPSRFLSRTER